MRRRLIPSRPFLKKANRLVKGQPHVETALRDTLDRLEADVFDPSLRVHKLHGKLEGAWAANPTRDLRIVFRFVDEKGGAEAGPDGAAILLAAVGTHREVY
jgi:mRNA-degrading endonuclease YafQ of YafQ-DinJ toxin-antitoxin module